MLTQTNTNLNETPAPAEPAAWIGLDWGHENHAFALQGQTGPCEAGTLPHSSESLHQWLGNLAERFGGCQVDLGIEASRGAVIHALVQYPWLRIYPINPVTSARYREAFTPSGASDDLPDAHVLLELVRDHAAKLRPLVVQDAQTILLEGLVQGRRHLVDTRTGVLNQLTSLLRSYYPQALQLLDQLDTALAIDFLERWPDLITLKASKPGLIKRFYYAHNLRSPGLLQERLHLIEQARALTTEPARVRVAVLQLHSLLDQLRTLRKHITLMEKEIKTAFADHPDAFIFRNLPGAGPALAPRLCVLFGSDRTLYPEPTNLQKLAGVAPVREKSGQQLWTHWRWLAPTFMRQTLVEWAGLTVQYSAWAKAYYLRKLSQGKGRGTILRTLAFKWVRILWKCWQTRVPYDEARYLQQLQFRKSPHAVKT